MPSRPESNRREFLLGKSISAEVEARLERAAENRQAQAGRSPKAPVITQSSSDRQRHYLEQYSKNAMACEFEWNFNLHQYSQSGPAAMEAFQLIDDLEDQLTVYRDHSEVSQLNRRAIGEFVSVETGLFQLLRLACQLHESTDGAFDITAAQLSEAWGFDRRQGRVPSQETIDRTLQKIGSQHLEFDLERTAIRINCPGVRINLGGIGKGYALDRAGQRMQQYGVFDFLLHGGQSSLLARGTSEPESKSQPREPSSTDSANKSSDSTETNPNLGSEKVAPSHEGWRIGITHPALPKVRLAEVTLHDQAMGTSGTAKQGFYHRGKRYGHIIDPRTGWPTNHFHSTTVIAPTAAVADALATAFFVMPMEEVEAFCRQRPDIGAILISGASKTSSQLKITTLNVEGFELVEGD